MIGEELSTELKKEYARENSRKNKSWQDVEIKGYAGEYENFVAVCIGYQDEFSDEMIEESVAGLFFHYSYGNVMSIYIKGEKPQPTQIPPTEGAPCSITELNVFAGISKEKVWKINIISGRDKAFTVDDRDTINEIMDIVISMTAKKKSEGNYYAPYVGSVTICQENMGYSIDFDVITSDRTEYILDTADLEEKITTLANDVEKGNGITYDKVYNIAHFTETDNLYEKPVRIHYQGYEFVAAEEVKTEILDAVCKMKIMEVRADASLVVSSQLFASIEIGTEDSFFLLNLMEKSSFFRHAEGKFLICDQELKTLISTLFKENMFS